MESNKTKRQRNLNASLFSLRPDQPADNRCEGSDVPTTLWAGCGCDALENQSYDTFKNA